MSDSETKLLSEFIPHFSIFIHQEMRDRGDKYENKRFVKRND